MVTGSVVETEAQWALYGKDADSEGYDVLACRSAIVQVLAGGPLSPTPALLAAILVLSSRPKDVRLAHEAYIQGSLTRMDVDSATAIRLREFLPESTLMNSPSPGEQE